MKKHLISTAIGLLMVIIFLSGCSKSNNTPAPPPPDPVVLTNTNWTGEFSYSDGTAQPMSIAFGESGTLLWEEFKGESAGSWKLENGLLTISISGTPSFTANVGSDSTLTNIKNTDAGGRKLLSATETSAEATLDGTNWEASNVSFKFKSGNKVDVIYGPLTDMPLYPNVSYIRKGKSIYFSVGPQYDWFLVLTSSKIIKGLNMAPSDPTLYTFFVTKK